MKKPLNTEKCTPHKLIPMSLPDLAAYRAAVTAAGVHIDSRLHLRFSDDAGYHIVASADVPPGDLLAMAPLRVSLDLSPDGPAAVELAGLGLPPLCASALLLQRELAEGGGALPAEHAALLRTLRTPRNVLYFDAAHQQALRGTSLQGATLHLRDRYKSLIAPFLSASPSFGSAALREDGCEGFLRAAAIVMSRCFHADGTDDAAAPSALAGVLEAAQSAAAAAGDSSNSTETKSASPTGPILAPFLDLFNHDPRRAATHNARVGDGFNFYALRPIAAGEEVFLSYGQLSDSQLLHTYGFLPEEEAEGRRNPHNFVLVPSAGVVSAVREALRVSGSLDAPRAKVLNAAASLLRQSGLLDDAGFVLGSFDGAVAEASPWRVLVACVPRSILTCLQVLLLDAPGFVEYKLAAAGSALELPLPSAAPASQPAAGVAGATPGVGTVLETPSARDPAEVATNETSDDDDDDDSDADSGDEGDDRDDAAATWAALAAVLRHKLATYPASMQEAAPAASPTKRARRDSELLDPSATPSDSVDRRCLEDSRLGGDPLLRQCWLLAMREKEHLHFLLGAVVSQPGSTRWCCAGLTGMIPPFVLAGG